MTLPQVEEQFSYWADHPPTHEILAARYGLKPKKRGKLSDLATMFPTGRMSPDGR